MIDELYINGVQVDMSDDNVINLTYQSNLFSDLNKISSSFSQTIKLPMTSNNLRIVDMCIYPGSKSNFPYIKHAGKVIRDGIEIIDNADVILLSVGDEIEISLSWGIISNISELVNSDAKISDLNFENQYITCDNVSGTKDIPIIYWGVNVVDFSMAFYHPVVYISNLIYKIGLKYNLNISIPQMDGELNKLAIPLTAQNYDSRNDTDYFLSTTFQTGYITGSSRRRLKFNPDSSMIFGFAEDNTKLYSKVGEIEASFVVNLDIIATAEYAVSDFKLAVCIHDEVVHYVNYTVLEKTLDTLVLRFVDEFKVSVKGNESQGINFQILLGISNLSHYISNSGLNSITVTSQKTLFVGSKYYYSTNLPDLKITDLLKAIKSTFGFYITTRNGNLIFEPYSFLYKKLNNAYDWTDNICIIGTEIPDTEYRIDDIAQKNIFLYKEDEKTSGNYSGAIYVNDRTIEKERDAFTSVFSGTDDITFNGVGDYQCLIPIYSWSNDKLNYKDVKPRIVYIDFDGDFYRTRFDKLRWQNLIDEYYTDYKKLITDAHIITVSVKLSPVELKNLDLTKPVYIGQYGCYFAIMEIKTKKNNICEAKLLKM